MKAITFIIFFLFTKIINAQIPVIEWQHSYGGSFSDAANSIATDFDGFISVGNTGSNDYDVSGHHGPDCISDSCQDFWLLKLAFDGSLIWQKCYGGSSKDWAYSVIPTVDSGYFACGTTRSQNGDVTGIHSLELDIWVIKTDHFGNLEWQKCYGGSSTDVAYSVTQTIDGGFAICGLTYSNDGDVVGHHSDTTVSDIWVLKINAIGDIQWQRCLGGSNDQESGFRIFQSEDQGFNIFGTASSINGDVIGLHGLYRDYWLIKLDSVGTIDWQKCIGGYLGNQLGLAMDSTTDKGFILSGITTYDTGLVTGFHGSQLIYDSYVVKVDSLGNIEHELCFGGSYYDYGNSIIQTYDGGYVFTGKTNSADGNMQCNNSSYEIFVIKIDTAFNIQWQTCLGGSSQDEAFSIIQIPDSGFLIAGYSLSTDGNLSSNNGYSDVWFIKLDVSHLFTPEASLSIENIYTYTDVSTGNININFNSNNTGNIYIHLHDITGKLLYRKNCFLSKGANRFEVNSGNLGKGLYLLKLSNELGESNKLIIY